MPNRTLIEARPGLDIGALSQFVGYWLRKAQVAFFEDFLRGAPAPKLTVGENVESKLLLTAQRIQDIFILNIHIAGRLTQFLRTQEAADVFGSKWWLVVHRPVSGS